MHKHHIGKTCQLVRVVMILGLLVAARAQETKGSQETERIVGYYYGKGRPDYQLSEVPVQKLTHLIYSRAIPTVHGDCQLAHPDIDIPNLQSLKTLRKQNPRMLVLLSVGGWSGSRYFSDVAASPAARNRFSASCLRILDEYDLDGIDIDWEYPVTGGKPTDHRRKADKENLVLLLRQLRDDLDASGEKGHRLLTIASTGYRNHLNDLSLKRMSDILDWFNLMGYDFNEMEPRRTFHHSGLFPSSTTAALTPDAIRFANSDAAVQWYVHQGVPPAKIVLGLPFYGQVWANVPNKNNGLFEPYRGRAGEDGTLSFRDIEQTYLPSYARHWDDQAKVPWLYNKTTKIMISYEDADSIRAKAAYVYERHLGGLMFWDLGQDDRKSTLLEVIHKQSNGD